MMHPAYMGMHQNMHGTSPDEEWAAAAQAAQQAQQNQNYYQQMGYPQGYHEQVGLNEIIGK